MRTDVSAAALAAMATEEVCEACVHSAGLCIFHVPHVCPTLRESAWHQDAHRGEHHIAGVNAPDHSPDVEKQIRHIERRDARRRGLRNFERQLAGVGFTKNRPRCRVA